MRQRNLNTNPLCNGIKELLLIFLGVIILWLYFLKEVSFHGK